MPASRSSEGVASGQAFGARPRGEQMRRRAIGALFAVVMMSAAPAHADGAPCRGVDYRDHAYVACEFDPRVDDIRLFHADAAGEPYRQFSRLKDAVEQRGDILLFAMNAGMYDDNNAPIGLYVEGGVERKPANTNDGPGNFHLKPNGVFFVGKGEAGVLETGAYLEAANDVLYATQSGPLLVIDGAIHPKFLENSDSIKRRNGVGVTRGGRVIFVIADEPVTFHEFASLFRDELKTPNALFLDGSISRLYAPELERNDAGLAMGPIVGVIAHAD